MLRPLITLFVALLVAILLFGWIEGYSSSFQQCMQNEAAANPSTKESKNQNNPIIVFSQSYFRCTERFANLHNALITAIATILLAVITFGLILSGIDQQKTARAQLRAYVMVHSVAITGISNGDKPDAHLTIKNYGQTPATRVTHWAKLGFSTFPVMSGPIPKRDLKEMLPEGPMAPSATLALITGVDLALNAPTIAAEL